MPSARRAPQESLVLMVFKARLGKTVRMVRMVRMDPRASAALEARLARKGREVYRASLALSLLHVSGSPPTREAGSSLRFRLIACRLSSRALDVGLL